MSESDTLIQPLDSLLRRTVSGRFELLEVIGSGGMATVYRSRDRRLDRDVAMKVLHSRFAGDRDFVGRFHREAGFAAGLSSHPNIVSIHDVGDDGDVHYIVMELVEGRNLKALIVEQAPFAIERAFAIGEQVLSALDFAHGQGLVHRDVKPQNILVCQDGQVKMTDFGIARRQDTTQITRSGMLLGTVAYVSPEQALGKPVTASSDIYSAGAVIYEMLTGRPPFEADSAIGLAMQHVRADPVPPDHLNPSISTGAGAVVLRALSKTPKGRYRHAAAFQQALRSALSHAGGAPLNGPLAKPGSIPSEDSDPPAPVRHLRRPGIKTLAPLTLAVALVAVLITRLAIGSGTSSSVKHRKTAHAVTRTPVTATVRRQVAAPSPTPRPTPSPLPALVPTVNPPSGGTPLYPTGDGTGKHGKGPGKAKAPDGAPPGQDGRGDGDNSGD